MSAPAKILVVDDDQGILDAIRFLLEVAGYEVVTSERNDEWVCQSIAQQPPDLIILDVLLSGQDGREICRRLKNDEQTSYIPVIMISAHPNAEFTVKSAGADAFLPKPFDIDDLLRQVGRFCSSPVVD